MTSKRRVTVYLPEQLAITVQDQADILGQSLSTWVERVIGAYLDGMGAAAIRAERRPTKGGKRI